MGPRSLIVEPFRGQDLVCMSRCLEKKVCVEDVLSAGWFIDGKSLVFFMKRKNSILDRMWLTMGGGCE